MSNDNIERRIEFIIEQQAKFSVDIEQLKEVQKQQGENINRLTETVDRVITEMHDGFNNLIAANEVTRDFANKIASLEVQTSQRMTKLEQRVSDIESKQ
jgi:uncharacterized coiled-coil protein SlyX